MASIELKGAEKWYGPVQVIKGVDLSISEGEFVIFVGPSGCGKSTLLRMIAGLEETSRGQIMIGDRDATAEPPARRGLAMVFQSYALYPHMSVRDNMGFSLKAAGAPEAEIQSKVNAAAEVLKLTPLLERRPKDLSGGQRQRVAIGRSIVRDPTAFLFDEPLSNLDAALRVEMRYEIAKLHQSLGATMIYVTHDQVEAMTLASRIVVLANKGVAQVGAPLELYERPNSEFVAQFIGSPAMNLLPGEVVATGAQTTIKLDGGGVALSDVPTQSGDMGLRVNVGIRPEDFVQAEAGAALYSGTVDITEALGEVTLCYFKSDEGAQPVIAKLPGIHSGMRGQGVALAADPSKVHLFADGVSLLYR